MISIIGGTYREINYDDNSIDIFGSGFRCAKYLLENNCDVNFHTSGNDEVINYLQENKKVYQKLKFTNCYSEELITFKYSYALDEPSIFPNILKIKKTDIINIEDSNIICYGMLETDFKVKGKKVIYDPQTSYKPIKFKDIGQACDLIYIVNQNEAESISSSNNLIDIKKYFFQEEKVSAFIIKNGPFGATLYYKDVEFQIHSFISKNVNKIGSGDIFTSSFGYYWMVKDLSLEDCAIFASRSTALYCDKKVYVDSENLSEFIYPIFTCKELSNKQVYLASPFFSIAELILVDKIRNSLLNFGVKVFSPFHDIGFGDDVTIAQKDIDGINNSDIIFCVFDNLDSGTLIESGYSLAKNKKIIGYHRTSDDNKLLMLKPSNIKMFNNLTTAIYHTIWNL
jgi:hypothetical protein